MLQSDFLVLWGWDCSIRLEAVLGFSPHFSGTNFVSLEPWSHCLGVLGLQPSLCWLKKLRSLEVNLHEEWTGEATVVQHTAASMLTQA